MSEMTITFCRKYPKLQNFDVKVYKVYNNLIECLGMLQQLE